MRHSSLVLAAFLSVSLGVLAQHSSSGGSSSGGSSGGPSHGGSSDSGSSGGSSSGISSSGSHSSSGSGVSHSSASSFARAGSGEPTRSASEARSARAGMSAIRSTDNVRMSPTPSEKTSAMPEKSSFVSHLVHPFRKKEVKLAQSDIRRRRPVCTKGHCECPGGGVVGKPGICSIPQTDFQCGVNAYWNGGGCIDYSRFRVGSCASLELMLRQQAQRAEVAEDARQASCSSGAADCGEVLTRATDEAARYRALQQQLDQCRRQNGYAGSYRNSFGYSSGMSPFAAF